MADKVVILEHNADDSPSQETKFSGSVIAHRVEAKQVVGTNPGPNLGAESKTIYEKVYQ